MKNPNTDTKRLEWLKEGFEDPNPTAGPSLIGRITHFENATWDNVVSNSDEEDGEILQQIANDIAVAIMHLASFYSALVSRWGTPPGTNARQAMEDLLLVVWPGDEGFGPVQDDDRRERLLKLFQKGFWTSPSDLIDSILQVIDGTDR